MYHQEIDFWPNWTEGKEGFQDDMLCHVLQK